MTPSSIYDGLEDADEFGFDELLCWTRIGGLENAKVLSALSPGVKLRCSLPAVLTP